MGFLLLAILKWNNSKIHFQFEMHSYFDYLCVPQKAQS